MTAELPGDVSIRVAEPSDRVGVRRVLDAVMLAVADLPDRLAAGEVLVATAEDRVVGAIALAPEGPAGSEQSVGPEDSVDPGGAGHGSSPDLPPDWSAATHVRSIAVRRRRRDRGVGSALVDAAAARFGPLVADFDADVAPFYRALGAEVRAAGSADSERYWALIDG